MAIQYNVTLHGGATNNNGVITNLGYAEINNVIDFASASSWEIQVKVIGGYGDPAYVIGGTDGNCGIFIMFRDNYYRPILIDSNGNYIGGADGSQYKAYSGTLSECILTLKFTGTQYEFYQNGNLYANIESSTSVKSFNSPLCLGNDYNGGSFDSHAQQIDLNDCYIKVDGANVWSGVSQGYNGVHIQLRRDTLANWTSANPVLYDGEVGLITDQAQYVVGDGTSTFTSLTKHNMDTNISNLANTNLSNITNTAKIAIAHNAMPSNSNVILTWNGSGTYTAASDGYFRIAFSISEGQWMYIEYTDMTNPSGVINGNSVFGFYNGTQTAPNMAYLVPVSKGQRVTFTTNATILSSGFSFIYAKGSESEVS